MPEGTTDNTAPSSASSGAVSGSSGRSGSVTSGTASAALLKAVEASSASSEPAAKPAEQTPTASATKPAATDTTGQAQPGAKGPIPFDVHEKALANAREKAIAQFAWAKGLDPKAVRQALGLMNELQSNTRGFWERLGKRLGTAAPTTETEDQMPAADIEGQGGVKAFSDQALLKALDVHGRKVQKTVLAELQPIIDFVNSESHNRQEQGRQREMDDLRVSVLSEARQAPHFKENETAIAEKMKEIAEADPSLVQTTEGTIRVLYRAYNAVLAEKVFPTVQVTAEEKVREANRRKAATSEGSVHPVTPQGEGKKVEPRNVNELARHMENLEKSLQPTG